MSEGRVVVVQQGRDLLEKGLEGIAVLQQVGGQLLHAQLEQHVGEIVGENLIGRDNKDILGRDGMVGAYVAFALIEQDIRISLAAMVSR